MKVKSVEYWRLLFAISIVLCHGAILPWSVNEDGVELLHASSHGVEFFFVLTGFLMARTVAAKQTVCTALGSETFSFLIRKMKVIFPMYLFAALFELAIHMTLRVNPPEGLIYRVWDILMLRASGLADGKATAVGGAWYLSAMLLGSWILYPLLRKKPDTFMYVTAPLAAILLFGWFETTYGHINFGLTVENGVSLGLLRGIAEMCAGIFSFALCERLKKILPEKPNLLVTAAEILCLGAVLYIAMTCSRGELDFIAILLVCVGLIAAFSGRSLTAVMFRKVSDRSIARISSFCLALYLNHYVWVNTLRDWKLAIPFRLELAIYLLLSLLTALACCATVAAVKTFLGFGKGREKKRNKSTMKEYER